MKQWFALIVQPRKEKVVEKELTKVGFDNYLPLKTEWHKWSDRRKLVSIPLIPSYIFVNTEVNKLHQVLNLPNTIRFIFFDRKAAVIPDNQILTLRNLLQKQEDILIESRNLDKGDRIKFINGRFQGLEGIILEQNNKKEKFIIRMDTISLDIVIKISAEDLLNAEKIQ